MQRNLSCVVAVFAVMAAFLLNPTQTAAGEALELTFSWTKAESTHEGVRTFYDGDEETPQEGTLVASLSATRLRVDHDGYSQIYDFEHGRSVRWKNGAETFTDEPLDALVGAIDGELINRLYLGEAVREAGITHAIDVFDPRRTEFELGVVIADLDEAATEISKAGDTWTYSIAGTEVLQLTHGEKVVPPGYREMYRKLLLYGFHVDPRLCESLADLPIPSEFRVYQPTPVGEVWTAYVLGEIAAGAAVPVVPEHLSRSYAASPETQSVIAACQKALNSGTCRTEEQFVQDIESFRSHGDLFEAVVTCFEFGLATGADATPVLISLKNEGAFDDARAQAFLSALGSIGEQPEAALRVFDALAEETPAIAHVLAIFAGNAERARGDSEAGSRRFRAALAVNPCIAGVWKDLGDAVLNEYSPGAAWECWEMALRIAPNHPLLEDVNRRAAVLRAKFPERF